MAARSERSKKSGEHMRGTRIAFGVHSLGRKGNGGELNTAICTSGNVLVGPGIEIGQEGDDITSEVRQ
jgi:hypothetical protein